MPTLKFIFGIISLTLYIGSTTAIFKFGQDDEPKEPLSFLSGNRPRISIFSKPPDPEAPKLTGPNILGHVSNVMHGGTIGVELQMKPGGVNIPKILGDAKKILPGGHTYPEVGRPENQKPPPPEPYDPPKGGNWEEEDDEHWGNNNDDDDGEDIKDWVPENPEKPVPDGPSWDDIGEDPEDDPTIPYEEIINPRLKPQTRPKRSISNSRVYYIPLKFRGNGKPFGVKFMDLASEKRGGKSLNGLH